MTKLRRLRGEIKDSYRKMLGANYGLTSGLFIKELGALWIEIVPMTKLLCGHFLTVLGFTERNMFKFVLSKFRN